MQELDRAQAHVREFRDAAAAERRDALAGGGVEILPRRVVDR